MNNFELENWLPMEPAMGPPLPRFLNIFWPWYEPPEEKVTVALKNPPADATMWTLTLLDWDMTAPIHWIGEEYIDITEAGVFEIPSGVKFPLKVITLQIVKWNENRTAYIVLYYVQSWHPTLYDWDKGEYGTEPDPTYKEIFIPEYGSYYYNVATERFEKI